MTWRFFPIPSGTTGLPKGCMLSHASVMHNAMTMSFWLDGTPEMVSLAVLPLFHITGSGMRDARLYFCRRDFGNHASLGSGLSLGSLFQDMG